MAASSDAILHVLSAGPGATLQDAGRHDYLRFGVTAAGPMDSLAHAAANLAVGNPAGATALEVSVGGIEVTAESGPLLVAVAGGEFALGLDGRPLPPAGGAQPGSRRGSANSRRARRLVVLFGDRRSLRRAKGTRLARHPQAHWLQRRGRPRDHRRRSFRSRKIRIVGAV